MMTDREHFICGSHDEMQVFSCYEAWIRPSRLSSKASQEAQLKQQEEIEHT